jgi:chemotaxis protein CheD
MAATDLLAPKVADRVTVGVSDMKISTGSPPMIITHALGSCLGLIIHDPVAGVAGMLHAMLPLAKLSPEKAAANPCMFVDTGVPALFRAFEAAGGQRSRAIVKAAGCAEPLKAANMFKIGSRNFATLKKLLWKNDLLLGPTAVGGTLCRTLRIHLDTGEAFISTGRKETPL